MTELSTTEVAGLLGLTPHQIRRCVRKALVAPARGRRGEFRFAFQDVVLLRMVKALLDERVPARRAARSLLHARARLSAARSLAGVRVFAQGGAVMVSEDNRLWEAESGQSALDFRPGAGVCEVMSLGSDEDPIIVLREVETWDSDAWYNLGLDLEDIDVGRASEAYRRAIELEPGNIDAYVNLGRLHQLAGNLEQAQRHYRDALERNPEHQLALYNLGTIFDELESFDEALACYGRAGSVPDAHFNLARICKLRGDELSARRHIRQYRQMLRR